MKRFGKWALIIYLVTQVVPGVIAGIGIALHMKGLI
jgi:hypothetical protein